MEVQERVCIFKISGLSEISGMQPVIIIKYNDVIVEFLFKYFLYQSQSSLVYFILFVCCIKL